MILTSGCANRKGVAPSQNSSLNTVSPSGTATSEGGAMQRSLDNWLKEEWTPLTTTTQTAPVNQPSQSTTPATVIVPTEETPFTLQKYADKWKAYQENKAKMNVGKPKEDSNIEKIQSMPVIGQ
jgi:hypothetical protein